MAAPTPPSGLVWIDTSSDNNWFISNLYSGYAAAFWDSAGQLVVVAQDPAGGDPAPWMSFYSDDGGASWSAGGSFSYGTATNRDQTSINYQSSGGVLFIAYSDADDDNHLMAVTWNPATHAFTFKDDVVLSSGSSNSGGQAIVTGLDTTSGDYYGLVAYDNDDWKRVRSFVYDTGTEQLTAGTLNDIPSYADASDYRMFFIYPYTLDSDPFALPTPANTTVHLVGVYDGGGSFGGVSYTSTSGTWVAGTDWYRTVSQGQPYLLGAWYNPNDQLVYVACYFATPGEVHILKSDSATLSSSTTWTVVFQHDTDTTEDLSGPATGTSTMAGQFSPLANKIWLSFTTLQDETWIIEYDVGGDSYSLIDTNISTIQYTTSSTPAVGTNQFYDPSSSADHPGFFYRVRTSLSEDYNGWWSIGAQGGASGLMGWGFIPI